MPGMSNVAANLKPFTCHERLQTNGLYALAESWCTQSHAFLKVVANSVTGNLTAAGPEGLDPELEMDQGTQASRTAG